MRSTMIHYFGERWDAPMLDGPHVEQVPTPIGQTCYQCGEPIADGDRGVLRMCMRLVDGQTTGTMRPVHTECEMLTVIGHMYGVCRCTGHGHRRADALVLLDRINAGRAAAGHGPL